MNTENSTNASSEVSVQCESIEPPSWLPEYRRFLYAVLKHEKLEPWELSVLLTDDETIRTYNRTYRTIDSATDVLSFSQTEGAEVPRGSDAPLPAGDLVISLETVGRNADEFGIDFREELQRVSIHGVLHLAGFVHTTNDTAKEPMLLLQERILHSLQKEFLF